MSSLWGDEFEVKPQVNQIKDVLKKATSAPKQASVRKKINPDISIEAQLSQIRDEVYRVLGKFADDTEVITSLDRFKEYIDRSIQNGVIAVDTETNNSLEPITCKLMGLCIYTPGEKNAYIPVNHVNSTTNILLPNQITESQIQEQLQKVVDANIEIIMHNGKFDYEVIKCTCNVEVIPTWDTLIAAKVLDENEEAGLKSQYRKHIDNQQEKYDIEHLFQKLEYAIVDPALFALYAATDAYETYKLYLWQKEKFSLPENQSLLKLFNTVEMPLVEVIAELELAGMEVDLTYADMLKKKYEDKLELLDKDIAVELEKLDPVVSKWRMTKEANDCPVKSTGTGLGKSKNEQLESPVNLASPTQLAILLYDILKAPIVNKKHARGTGEEELKAIAEKLNLPICDLILKRRELVKLLTTYIETIPKLAEKSFDHRVRTHFNQYGAATGRLSSSEPINF